MESSTEAATTILLVDDDDAVRRIARKTLERDGHGILEARSASEALAVARTHDGPIHLLLTDVMMPGMSGNQLVRHFWEERPGTPVLCLSGYAEADMVRYGVLEAGLAFMEKPFQPVALSEKVREILTAAG